MDTYELFTTRDGRMISPNFWLHLFRRESVAGFIKRFQVNYRENGNILVRIVKKQAKAALVQQDRHSALSEVW